MNWDTVLDNQDADRRLDLIVAWDTDTSNSSIPRRATLHTSGNQGPYRWLSVVINNVDNGTGPADFYGYTIADNTPEERAAWIFDDLRRGSEFVKGHTNPSVDPGASIAYWENGVTDFGLCRPGSCFFGGVGGPWIFINDVLVTSHDNPEHELGHQYMYTATGGWWNASTNCMNPDMWLPSDEGCAWSEGWAYFFALAANNDPVYDTTNLETPTWGDGRQQGHTVKARVAGALWDLFDPASDGTDNVNFGFGPIWTVMARHPGLDNFRAFWDRWVVLGYDRHGAVRAIYQNTIDYDAVPTLNVPSQMVLRNGSLTFDLWPYTYDLETNVTLLTYPAIRSTDARYGANLNTHFVNLRPQANWTGSCTVSVDVNDTLKTGTGNFTVQVVPWGTFLPLIMK